MCEAMAPWKSANQWYVNGTPAKYGTSGGKLPWTMLEPIATWTSRSLQFQPPETQPSSVSCQPLANSTTATTTPTNAAMSQAAASSRSVERIPAAVGRPIGASQACLAQPTATAPATSNIADTMIEGRSKPPIRATTSTRCADR